MSKEVRKQEVGNDVIKKERNRGVEFVLCYALLYRVSKRMDGWSEVVAAEVKV